MLTLTSIEINTWIEALLWPLTRILGLVTAAPLFGNTSFPISSKVGLGVMLALIIAPTVPALPAADPLSMAGLLILVQEMLIGVAMGFAMRIVFAAVEMAGEVASMTMGLGFATVFDPQSKGRSSAVSQFVALIATMAFLAVNGHLVLLEVLAESFVSLPISATPISGTMSLQVLKWASVIFSTGLQLSLPIVAALLVTTVALGILTRAAPQLNIFGIGFPITLSVGILLLSQTLPYLSGPLQTLFNEGLEASRAIARGAAQRKAPTVPVALPPSPARPAPATPAPQ